MADFHRYQPRHSSAGSGSWRRLVIPAILIVVVILVIRGVWGGDDGDNNKNNSTNEPAITLINETTNSANNANVANGNANANTSIVAAEPTSFSLERCKSAISQHGTKKVVALTFDVSAANDQAKQVITALAEAKTPSSWFVSGTFATKNPAFVSDIAKAGIPLYNRSNDNPRFSTLTKEEVVSQLSKADQAITAAANRSSKPFFRPPYGDYAEATVTTAQEQGYCTILWTVDALDWQEGITQDQAKQRVLDKLRAGAIIGLHAGYDVTPALVKDLVTAIAAQGYSFVSLPALLAGE